jgi:excisionase family DNA binding protein
VVNALPGTVPGLEPYIEVGRAAAYLSMSRKTLLKKARAGRLPAHPIGEGRKKMWRFRLSELDRWMQTEVTSGSDGGCSKERQSFL